MNKLVSNIKQSAIVGSVIALAAPLIAKAQDETRAGLELVGWLFPGTRFDSGFEGLIVFIIQILLYLAGAIAVLFVIIGGFQYIMSAGNAETAAKGKKTVINAIIGIVLIILSYLIISVIVNELLMP